MCHALSVADAHRLLPARRCRCKLNIMTSVSHDVAAAAAAVNDVLAVIVVVDVIDVVVVAVREQV